MLVFVKKIIGICFLGIIYVYRYGISPVTPASCRYYPTCSEYGVEAIKEHGAFLGGWLTIKRILRCNPFFSGGFDPVPGVKCCDKSCQDEVKCHSNDGASLD